MNSADYIKRNGGYSKKMDRKLSIEYTNEKSSEINRRFVVDATIQMAKHQYR